MSYTRHVPPLNQAADDNLDFGANRVQWITPGGDHPFGSDHPPHLGVEHWQVEPVEGLGDGYQIDRGVTEGRLLGGDEEVEVTFGWG